MGPQIDYITFRYNLCEEFDNILHELGLTKKYCTFIIGSNTAVITDYFKYIASPETQKTRTLDSSELADLLDKLTACDDNTFMYALSDKRGRKIYRRVFFPELNLYRLLCNHNKLSDIMEYCKQVMRHEIGHHLYDDYIHKTLGYNEGEKYMYNKYKKDIRAYNRYQHQVDNDDDYDVDEAPNVINYFYMTKIEQEAKANEYGQVDLDKYFRLHAKINI